MKILYVTTISNTVNAFLVPHIRMLIEQGHQVDVAFNVVQEANPSIIDMGCKIHNITFQRSPLHRKNISAYLQLKQILKNEDYDVVHTHTPTASVLVRLACRKIKKIKVIYTAHGFHFFKGAPLKNWLLFFPVELILAKYTETIITINTEDYTTIKKYTQKNKNIELINGVGVNLEKYSIHKKNNDFQINYRKELDLLPTNFVLTFVAELSHRKNQIFLLNVVKKLTIKLPDIKLLLVGSGELHDYYQSKINELGLEEHVKLLGYRTDIDQILSISDLVVSSSLQEGLPVNILEAMAMGLPIIATNCRGNRDLIKNGKNGYLFEVDEINNYALAVEELYNDEKMREKFGNQNKKDIKAYDLNKVLISMKKFY